MEIEAFPDEEGEEEEAVALPKDKEEASAVSDDEEEEVDAVMKVVKSLESLCENDVPYFSIYPQEKYFGASVHGALTSAVFVMMMLFFNSYYKQWLEEEAMFAGDMVPNIAELTTFIYYIKKPESFMLRSKVVPNATFQERIAHMKEQCIELSSSHKGSDFFIAFSDETGHIFVYTGNNMAPYNPTFHLFFRILKDMRDQTPFIDFANIKPSYITADNMKESMLAYEADGKMSARQAFAKAIDIINAAVVEFKKR